MTYDVENPGPGLEQAQTVVGLNQVMESQSFYLDKWISNGKIF